MSKKYLRIGAHEHMKHTLRTIYTHKSCSIHLVTLVNPLGKTVGFNQKYFEENFIELTENDLIGLNFSYGEKIEVRDNPSSLWCERFFLSYQACTNYPVRASRESPIASEYPNVGSSYKYCRAIPKETVERLTLAQIAEKYEVDRVEIIEEDN